MNVQTIINDLEKWVPFIISEAKTLKDPVKGVISALQNSGHASPDQITQLKQLDAKVDAEFEEAIKGLDPDEAT